MSVVRLVEAVRLAGAFRQAVRLLRHGVRPSVGGAVRGTAVVVVVVFTRTIARQRLQSVRANMEKKNKKIKNNVDDTTTGSIFQISTHDFQQSISVALYCSYTNA